MTSCTNRFGQNNQIKFFSYLLIDLSIDMDWNATLINIIKINKYYILTFIYYIDMDVSQK